MWPATQTWLMAVEMEVTGDIWQGSELRQMKQKWPVMDETYMSTSTWHGSEVKCNMIVNSDISVNNDSDTSVNIDNDA